jgi:hypothetical protein
MSKNTDLGNLVNGLFVDSSRNVGIGTQVPSTQLQINGTPSNDWGNITLFDTRTQAINQGGMLAFAGYKTGTSAAAIFAQIKGNKENGTSANEAGYLSFLTNNNTTYVERMRITSAGNVGIGNTAPVNQLDLNRTGAPTLFDAGFNAVQNGGEIEMRYVAAGQAGGRTGSHIFYTGTAVGGSERMRITSGGNVGIGTSSPNAFNLLTVLMPNNTNQTGIAIKAINDGGTASQPAVNFLNGTGNLIGTIYGDNGTGYLGFNVGSAGTERMRITSAGYLKVANNGTYWFPTGTQHELNQSTTGSDTVILRNTSAVPYGMYMYFNTAPNNTTQYFIECSDGANTKISLYSNGSIYNRTGTYAAYSDIKLKENIVDATPKLDDLLKVKIRNYNLIGDDLKQIGVIAQELEEIFPNMIDDTVSKETGEITKGVKYSIFIPMLIKAIQELKAEIEILKQK